MIAHVFRPVSYANSLQKRIQNVIFFILIQTLYPVAKKYDSSKFALESYSYAIQEYIPI